MTYHLLPLSDLQTHWHQQSAEQGATVKSPPLIVHVQAALQDDK